MADSAPERVRALIAYDGSPGADDAVRAAGQLLPGADALLLHARGEPVLLEHTGLGRIAVPDSVLVAAQDEYERVAREGADAVVAQGLRVAEGSGLRATGEVAAGTSAWRAATRAAEQFEADVIVCGSRGQGRFSRALLGSTSTSLLFQADRPVLIAPEGAGDLSGPAALAYEDSDGARAAVATAARLLAGRPAVLVHAWSSPLERSYAAEALVAVPLPEARELTADVEELFAARGAELAEEGRALAQQAGLAARGVAVEAEEGVWRAVAAAARAEHAAVIVVGSRGRGAIASTVLGSVSAGLVHNAELPVLVAR